MLSLFNPSCCCVDCPSDALTWETNGEATGGWTGGDGGFNRGGIPWWGQEQVFKVSTTPLSTGYRDYASGDWWFRLMFAPIHDDAGHRFDAGLRVELEEGAVDLELYFPDGWSAPNGDDMAHAVLNDRFIATHFAYHQLAPSGWGINLARIGGKLYFWNGRGSRQFDSVDLAGDPVFGPNGDGSGIEPRPWYSDGWKWQWHDEYTVFDYRPVILGSPRAANEGKVVLTPLNSGMAILSASVVGINRDRCDALELGCLYCSGGRPAFEQQEPTEPPPPDEFEPDLETSWHHWRTKLYDCSRWDEYRASAYAIGSPDWSTTGEATTSTVLTVNRDGDVLRIVGDGTTSESTNLGPAPTSC